MSKYIFVLTIPSFHLLSNTVFGQIIIKVATHNFNGDTNNPYWTKYDGIILIRARLKSKNSLTA